MSKGWGAQTCRDKLFCRERFRCRYAHHDPNTGASPNICENPEM